MVGFDVDPVNNYLGLVVRVASDMQVPLAAVPWVALVQSLGTSNTGRYVGSKKFHNCIISPLAVRFPSQPDCSPTPADMPTDPFQHLHLELSRHFRMNMPQREHNTLPQKPVLPPGFLVCMCVLM